jgi:hypothetical protein
MTNSLHLPATTGGPIVCDMSTATDTPDERLRAYAELFAGSLLRRERQADGVGFTFRADPGTREAVEELARREAACCPFLAYRVENAGGEVTYTMTNPLTGDAGASVNAVLDEIHALPDHAGSGFAGPSERVGLRGRAPQPPQEP